MSLNGACNGGKGRLTLKTRVTLKDIARETGVHVSTVSRALDPNARSSLTDEVVERIKAAASSLGYRPNRLAYGLRTNRTMTVGVMIPDITNMLFPPIVRGIESVLEPLGYASMIVNTDNQVEREARLIEVLSERGVDGIIHAAVLRSDPKIAEVAAQGLPVITLNRRIEGEAIPYVINDEYAGVRLMLEHLFEQGHRHVAHIAGPSDLSTGQTRFDAFKRASCDLGLPLPQPLTAISTRFDEDEGRRCAGLLLDAGEAFTAILCANDRLALGAIDRLRQHGLDCPKDVSVTGFNDMPFLDLIPPALTTIRIRQFEAGQAVARLLLDLIGPLSIDVPPETILPVELVRRESVAPPKAARP